MHRITRPLALLVPLVLAAPLHAQGGPDTADIDPMDLHGCPLCTNDDLLGRGPTASGGAPPLTAVNYQKSIELAAEGLGLDIVWTATEDGDFLTGEVELGGGEGCGSGTRVLHFKEPVPSEGPRGQSAEYTIEDDPDDGGVQHVDIVIFDGSLQGAREQVTQGQPEHTLSGDGSYASAARTGMLMHELLHICRGDEGEYDSLSCAHLQMDAVLVHELCDLVAGFDACADVAHMAEPPEDPALAADFEQRYFDQLDCLDQVRTAFCHEVRGICERWRQEDALRRANQCADDDDLQWADCCGTGSLGTRPPGGWTEDDPPIVPPCADTCGC